MLENTDETENATTVIHRECQQVVQVNQKAENFQIKN